MKNIKAVILIAAAAVVLLGTDCYYSFQPVPIITDADECHIARIQYRADSTVQLVDAQGYDEKEILNYLSTCFERRTLERAGTYLLGDVQIDIMIRTEKGMKEILLGDIHYSSCGYGTAKFDILNFEEVKTTLLNMIHE